MATSPRTGLGLPIQGTLLAGPCGSCGKSRRRAPATVRDRHAQWLLCRKCEGALGRTGTITLPRLSVRGRGGAPLSRSRPLACAVCARAPGTFTTTDFHLAVGGLRRRVVLLVCGPECARRAPRALKQQAAAEESLGLHLRRQCGACAREAPAMRKCGGCRHVYYCTPACQKAAWPAHRANCGRPEGAGPGPAGSASPVAPRRSAHRPPMAATPARASAPARQPPMAATPAPAPAPPPPRAGGAATTGRT